MKKITLFISLFLIIGSIYGNDKIEMFSADSETVAYESTGNVFDVTSNDTAPGTATYIGFAAFNATTSSSDNGTNNITLTNPNTLTSTITYNAPDDFAGTDTFTYYYYDATDSQVGSFQVTITVNCPTIDDSAISAAASVIGNDLIWTISAPAGVTVSGTATTGAFTAVDSDQITITGGATAVTSNTITLESAAITTTPTCINDFADKPYKFCPTINSGGISAAGAQNGTNVEFTITAPTGVTVAYSGDASGTAVNGDVVVVTKAVLTSGTSSITINSAYLTSDNTCSTTLGGVPFTYNQTWCNPPAESDVSASVAVVGDNVVFTFNMSANVTATVNMISNGSTQTSALSVTNGTTYTFAGGNLVHSIDLEAVFTDAHLTSDNTCNTDYSPDKTITFTVPRSNHPLAIDDVYPLDQTKSREISPLTRGTDDSDPNNLALSIKSINGVAILGGVQTIAVPSAVINIDANDIMTFVPDVTFAGTIQFPYVIQNTNNYEDDGLVTVNVAALPNQPTTPTAVADSYTMNQDTTIEIDPLTKGTNDSDPNDLDFSIHSINGISLTGSTQSIAVTNGTVDIDVNGGITFTPLTGYTGTIVFPYVIQNILGDTATADVTIVVDAVTASPTAPTATDDNYTVDQYDTVKLRPLTKGTNDSDPNDKDLYVYAINGTVIDYTSLPFTVTSYTDGTLIVNGNDDIDFTPNTSTSPVEIYYYVINEPMPGLGGLPAGAPLPTLNASNSADAKQTIVVTAVSGSPTAPTATDDNYTVDQYETIQLRPLTKGTNDSDPNNQALTIYSIAGEEIDYNNLPYTIPNFTGGTLVVNGADDIDFTPTAATTPVTIPYVIVNDGNVPSGTNDATANEIIIVTPVATGPSNPVATDDNYTVDQYETIQLRPLTKGTNDSDPNNQALTIYSIAGEEIDYNNLPYTIPNFTGGTLVVNGADDIDFTPTAATTPVTIPYVIVNDGNAPSGTNDATANEIIIVTPVATGPSNPVATDDNYTVDQYETIQLRPLTKGTNDSDPNNQALTIYSIAGEEIDYNNLPYTIPGFSGGTLVVNGADDIDFTPTAATTPVTIPYVIVNDGNAPSGTNDATANEIIIVTPVATGPSNPVATDDNYTVDQYETIQLRPLTKGTNDSDPNNQALTIYSIAGEEIDYNNLPYTIPGFTGGTLVVNGADDIDFTPTAATTPVTIPYVIVNDGNAPSGTNDATANEIIIVTPVATGPSNPVATDDNYTVDQYETIQLRPLTKGTNDSDPNNQALTIYSIAGEEIDYNNLPYTIPGFTGGTLVVNGADDIDFTPTAATTPVTIPYVIVNDGNVPSGTNDATANEIIIVTPVAAAPTAPTATDDNYSIEAGETVQLRPLTKGTNDSDPNNLELTITHIAGEEIMYNALPYTIPGFVGGTLVVNGADDIDFTPTLDNVDYIIPYTIKNTNNETASANEIIIVAPAKVVATAPVAVDDVYSMVQNTSRELYPLTRGVNDSDPNGDPLSITKMNNEAITGGVQTIIVPNGLVSIDGSGVITFTPDANYTGTTVFSYEITDGNGNFDVGTQTINVLVSRTDTTGINDEINIIDDKFTVYPNPSNGNMVVFLTSEKEGTAKIILSDMSGRVIYSRDTNIREGQNEIDMTFNVSRGVKFLQVVTPTQKLVKRVIFR